jgi:hypothetical protein
MCESGRIPVRKGEAGQVIRLIYTMPAIASYECYTNCWVCEWLTYKAFMLGVRDGANTNEKSIHLAVRRLIENVIKHILKPHRAK